MNRIFFFTRFHLFYHIYILHHHYKPKDPFHNQDKCTKYIQLSFPNFESYNYVIVNGKPEIETIVINTAMSVEFYILWQRTYIVYLYSEVWTVGYCDITFTNCVSFIVFQLTAGCQHMKICMQNIQYLLTIIIISQLHFIL